LIPFAEWSVNFSAGVGGARPPNGFGAFWGEK